MGINFKEGSQASNRLFAWRFCLGVFELGQVCEINAEELCKASLTDAAFAPQFFDALTERRTSSLLRLRSCHITSLRSKRML